MKKVKSVPNRLRDLGKIYEERNALYGDSYKEFGKLMAAMFPAGISLKTAEQFNRFSLFLHIVDKVRRYGGGNMLRCHPDSLDDLSVYAQMLSETDEECQPR